MFAQRNVIEIELEKEPNEIKDSIVITKLRNEQIRCPRMFIVMLRNVTKRAIAVKITEMYLRRKKCILTLRHASHGRILKKSLERTNDVKKYKWLWPHKKIIVMCLEKRKL